MKMKKNSILYLFAVAMLAFACSTEDDITNVAPEKGAIQLSGVTLRNDGVNGSNIYLMAEVGTTDPAVTYIGETRITFPEGLDNVEHALVFPGAVPHYPLDSRLLRFFAYSGKAKGGKMVVKAGLGADYDAVLSNNGRQQGSFISPANEGAGTPGSKDSPAELLQFRHVMTQVIVHVEVDQTEDPPVDPVPKTMKFKLPGVAAQGLYSIKAKAPVEGSESSAYTAESATGAYTVQLGTNYLVPNGEDLVGRNFSSLVIDDYTATPEDLAGFTIQALNGSPNFYLLAGYSYNLTITVQRLRVTGVRISQIPWQPTEITNDSIKYEPYALNLDMGEYTNTGTDEITKVVLHTTENKVYVGATETGRTGIQFVTLPATGTVNQADFYTKKGLLLTSSITNEYVNNPTDKTLTLSVSKGGMLPEDPSLPYSPTNPYLITTAVQFLNVDKDLTVSYKQGVNVNLKDLFVTGSEAVFGGFGTFSGNYDGNGYFISGLNVDGPGMFATNAGILRNIRIYTGVINAAGANYAGSICGTNQGTIVGCINEATIVNSTATVGGICGLNETSGVVIASLNTGVVTHGTTVGGIAGANNNTNAQTISACINTGVLNEKATNLGGLCGTSQASSNSVVDVSFWLIGTAEKYIGSLESAVGSNNVGKTDTSSLDPEHLRNGLYNGHTEEDKVVNRLNTEIASFPAWSGLYQYVLNRSQTGITWPAPVKK